MTATNQQMTSQQLDELMLVAVSMQRDAEKLDERQVAVFAYAIQLVLAEFQNTRQQLAAVVAENAGLKAAVGAVNGIAEECEVNGDEFKYVVEPSEFEALIDLLDETPATDAAIANIQAQGVEMLAERKNKEMMSLHPDTHAVGSIAAAMSAEVKELREFAAQLRQEAQ